MSGPNVVRTNASAKMNVLQTREKARREGRKELNLGQRPAARLRKLVYCRLRGGAGRRETCWLLLKRARLGGLPAGRILRITQLDKTRGQVSCPLFPLPLAQTAASSSRDSARPPPSHFLSGQLLIGANTSVLSARTYIRTDRGPMYVAQ